jgi:hypothetical protein
MSLDFAAMIQEGKKSLENKNVAAILLGASGNGKSRACGTFGVKTLYLHTSSESHGAQSAAMGGSEIVPICIDRDKGVPISPDDSYKRILDILGSTEQLKKLGIGAVALDGASEIETIITGTNLYKSRVAAEYKGNTSFAGPVVLSMFRSILVALQKLQADLGIHYVVTCILNIRELGDNGQISDAEPKLAGYNVATGLIQQFPDVLAIGRVSNGEREEPMLQFGAHVQKTTKDFTTKEVRKLHNFNIRITGVDLSEAPEMLKPNFARIIEFKKASKYVAKGG